MVIVDKSIASSRGSKITLYVRELGRTKRFALEEREKWSLGRATPENKPDIPLKSRIAGRFHGEFLLVDGQLFYIDRGSVNGTFHNGKKLSAGLRGRANPVLLSDGDVLQIDFENLDTSDADNVRIEVKIDG